MRMATAHAWTRAELERFPDDGNRYEVLDGELLVTPQASVRHQRIAVALLVRLATYCDEHNNGLALGPAAAPEGKSELQPDIAVFQASHDSNPRWEDLRKPLLVVEVLSPSTRRRDLGIKRDAYLRWGVRECWFVDPDARSVRIAKPGADELVETKSLRWRPTEDAPALVIDVASLPW